MTLAAAFRWLLPHRKPTPWAAWLRERRQPEPAPMLDDDGRPVRVRGQVWYDLPTADEG